MMHLPGIAGIIDQMLAPFKSKAAPPYKTAGALAPAVLRLRYIIGVYSAEVQVEDTGPVGQNGGIDHLTATGALPGIEGPHKVIVFFGIHAALALGTFHGASS
jgi:hypothetical protein